MFNILNYSCSLLLFVLVSTIIYNYMNKEGFEIKPPTVLPKPIHTTDVEDTKKYHIIPYFTPENQYSHYYVYDGSSSEKKSRGIYNKANAPVFAIDTKNTIKIDNVYSRTYYNTDGENTTLIHLKDTSNKKSAIIKINKDTAISLPIFDRGSSDDNKIHMAYDTNDERVIIINPDSHPKNTKTLKIDIYHNKDNKPKNLNTDSKIDTIYDIYCFDQFLYVLAKADKKYVIYKINISENSGNMTADIIQLSSVFNRESNIKSTNTNMHMLVDKTNIYIINRDGKFYMFSNKTQQDQNQILNTKDNQLSDFDENKELAHAKIYKEELYYIYRTKVGQHQQHPATTATAAPAAAAATPATAAPAAAATTTATAAPAAAAASAT